MASNVKGLETAFRRSVFAGGVRRGAGGWWPADATGAWDFVGGRYFGGFSFARASTGYYFNQAGLLVPASTNVPRLDRDPLTHAVRGLLLEPAATNLLVRSEEFGSVWAINNVSILSDQTTAPDGQATADKMREVANNATHLLTNGAAIVNGSNYSNSIFLKAAERSWAQVTFGSMAFSSLPWANFDLANGVVGHTGGLLSSTMLDCGGGWYRCEVIGAATATTTTTLCAIGLTQNLNSATRLPSYAGHASLPGIYMFGAQGEIGSRASSYIPTAGSSATRAADQLTLALGAGAKNLTVTFDNDNEQVIAGVSGDYVVDPTALNRPHVKSIVARAA